MIVATSGRIAYETIINKISSFYIFLYVESRVIQLTN